VYLYQKLGSLLILLLFISPGILAAERIDETPKTPVENLIRLEAPQPDLKTIFFITYADEFNHTLGRILSYEDGGNLRILKWNYCFQPFKAWGLYFEFTDGWTDEGFTASGTSSMSTLRSATETTLTSGRTASWKRAWRRL
jgi:hypothetical protein